MTDKPIFKPIRLTDRQMLIWLLHRRCAKKVAIARRLGISPQAVQKSWKQTVVGIEQLAAIVKLTGGNPSMIEQWIGRELRRGRLAKFLDRDCDDEDPFAELMRGLFSGESRSKGK